MVGHQWHYIWKVPTPLLKSDLSTHERMAVIALRSHDGPNSKGIYPSLATIKQEIGCSLTGARRALDGAERKKWIKRHPSKGKSNRYTWVHPCLLETGSLSLRNRPNLQTLSRGDTKRDPKIEREQRNDGVVPEVKIKLPHQPKPTQEQQERLRRQFKASTGKVSAHGGKAGVNVADKLYSLPSVERSQPVAKRLLSVQEAARYLDMAPGTLYNWASARRVTTVKMGRSLKFDIRDLERMIEENRALART